jgi:hypothetical protein
MVTCEHGNRELVRARWVAPSWGQGRWSSDPARGADSTERSIAMSNRWVFLAAFLTATFMVAGAFALPPYFYFELVTSSIFIAIGVMVFFGEDRYSYMLGIVFTSLWFLVDLLMGGFISDFRSFFHYLGGHGISALSTPLNGFARLAAIFLFAVSLAAWRREVNERFWGKTFWKCLIISVAYVGILTVWYLRLFPLGR